MSYINFNNVEDAYSSGGKQLIKIYAAGDYLLWERGITVPIVKSTDPFLLVENPNYLEYTYKGKQYGSDEYTYKYFGINHSGIITPQVYTKIENLNSAGKVYYTYDMKSTIGWGTDSEINGFKKSSKVIYGPGVWQFVQFEGYSGIYLYSPTWNKIVSKTSGFWVNKWKFTSSVLKGFDWSPYLKSNVFSSSGWTTQELYGYYLYWRPNYGTTAQYGPERESWQWKELFTRRQATVTIFVPDPEHHITDNISTWVTYDDKATLRRYCMVKPVNKNSLSVATSTGKLSFTGAHDNNRFILPYRAGGWGTYSN